MVVFAVAPSTPCAVPSTMQRAVDRHNRRPGTIAPRRAHRRCTSASPSARTATTSAMPVERRQAAVRRARTADRSSRRTSSAGLVGRDGRARIPVARRHRAQRDLPSPSPPSEVVWAPAAAAGAAAAAGPARPYRAHPFVGREPSNETSSATQWKRAASGERRTVLVAGEPGIGKTRLCDGARRRGPRPTARSCCSGAATRKRVIPYQPFVEALRFYVVDTRRRPSSREQLGEGAPISPGSSPSIGERVAGLPRRRQPIRRPSATGCSTPSPRCSRGRRARLRSCSSSTTCTGPTGRRCALLRHVIRERRARADPRRRHVPRHRARSPPPVRRDARRPAPRARITSASCCAVCRRTTSSSSWSSPATGAGRPRAGSLAQRACTETEGNPFFMEEIMLHLVETGRIYQDEDRTLDIRRRRRVASSGSPKGVREAVGRRLARLSDEANDALAQAAVLGPRFEYAELARDGRGWTMTCSRAARSRRGDRSSLLETVRRDGGAGVRVRARDRAADAVRGVVPASPAATTPQGGRGARGGPPEDTPLGAIATHYRAAGAAAEPQKAIDYSLLAGQQAVTVFAFEEALKHLEAARELMDEQGIEPEVRARLLAVPRRPPVRDRARLREGRRCARGGPPDLGRASATSPRPRRSTPASDERFRRSPSTWTSIERLDHFREAEAVLSTASRRRRSGYTYIGLAGAALWAHAHRGRARGAQRAWRSPSGSAGRSCGRTRRQ